MPSRARRAPRAALLCSVAAAVVIAGVLAACSNTSSPVNRRPHTGTATAAVTNGVQHVTIDAGDNFRFSPSTVYVHAGMAVRITLVHTGNGAPHNWQLTGFPGDAVPLVTAQGEALSTTFMPPAPGRYQFVCTIHVKQGQTGTLVVLP